MGDLAALPDEMFTLITRAAEPLTPRLGRLALPTRNVVQTPHYLACTSRGTVPHITPDTIRRDTSISGVYLALEDFIERAPQKTPPIYHFKPPDGSSSLRRFISLPDPTLLVLGPRRISPVIAPAANPNTNTSIAVSTAVGFRTLKAEDYVERVEQLKPDIVVGIGDVPYGRKVGSKRVEKGTERMGEWTGMHVKSREDMRGIGGEEAGPGTGAGRFFAPLFPAGCGVQWDYVEALMEELREGIEGLAVYSEETLEDLPEELHKLPRLAFLEPKTPHQVLTQVALGCDVLTVPFIGQATDAGIALDFAFPAPGTSSRSGEDIQNPLPLGIDMWLPTHATSLVPLSANCTCYACTTHHRAYLHHLLSAKEMLGWILLQIHNHHTLDRFFASVRSTIAQGTFEEERKRFERSFEAHMPEKTGQGPRVRGYQFKSEGPGEGRKNPAPFTMLSEGKEGAEDANGNVKVGSQVALAEKLEDTGLAEKAEDAAAGADQTHTT